MSRTCKVVVGILVTMCLVGCPHMHNTGLPPSVRIPVLEPNKPASGIRHTVSRDESLAGIAGAYQIDQQYLAEVNNLAPPYSVKAHSNVFIPGAASVKPLDLTRKPIQQKTKVEDFSGILAWPVHGKIITHFGVKDGIQHDGILIKAPEGVAVRSAGDGKVGYVGAIPGYGNTVLVDHPGRLVTVYAHLKESRTAVGKTVKKGEIIGTLGKSGRVETPSLYFEVRSRTKPRNPLFFLDRRD
jgi:murein DD-endopeptidase MepM/ murein hydrolase activator NlpD